MINLLDYLNDVKKKHRILTVTQFFLTILMWTLFYKAHTIKEKKQIKIMIDSFPPVFFFISYMTFPPQNQVGLNRALRPNRLQPK